MREGIQAYCRVLTLYMRWCNKNMKVDVIKNYTVNPKGTTNSKQGVECLYKNVHCIFL